jgi:hypothetical protein
MMLCRLRFDKWTRNQAKSSASISPRNFSFSAFMAPALSGALSYEVVNKEERREVGWEPEPSRSGFVSDLAPLFRVVLALGVRDNARGDFWRYLLHAFGRRRECFAEAVRLASVGYHFRKLTEDVLQSGAG